MPYSSTSDLPDSTADLPHQAKMIFMAAFNASFERYGEEGAFKVAWAAVKRKYRKEGDKWVKKSE